MNMAYDVARDRMVLAHLAPSGTGEEVLTTWEFDGQRWDQRTLSTHPPPRYDFGLTYDELRRRTVLFGGVHAVTWEELNDTWEFDGQRWTQIPTTHAPSPRRDPALTYAPRHGRVLLFGGRCSYADFCAANDRESEQRMDTWTYDGTDWSSVPTAAATELSPPHPHPPAVLAHHVGLDRVLLLAKNSPSGAAYYTWLFDGARWESHAEGDWVSLGEPAAAWEPSRERLLVVGRREYRFHTLAYDPDGESWIDQWPDRNPPLGQGIALATDTARRRLVYLVWGVLPSPEHTETWLLRSDPLLSTSPPP
jgi:hypothetical protein